MPQNTRGLRMWAVGFSATLPKGQAQLVQDAPRVLLPMGIGGSMDGPPCLGAPHPGGPLPRTNQSDANALWRLREIQACVLARLLAN